MGQHTILLVEDETPVRELLAHVLSDEGYRVVEARNGAEAIRALDTQSPADRFSLVLLDLMLPIVDGFGVLRHLADRAARPPVVAMSASPSHLAAAQSTGAQATLPKPFDLDVLLNIIAHHVAHHYALAS